VGGETPSGADLNGTQSAETLAQESRRRMALVQLVVGAPAFLFVVFGLVLAYRFADRSLGDTAFWAVLVPVVVAFGIYYGRAIVALRRSGGGKG
jgi:hypothetical protein